eukprot:5685513-Amphidinium_carterae.1
MAHWRFITRSNVIAALSTSLRDLWRGPRRDHFVLHASRFDTVSKIKAEVTDVQKPKAVTWCGAYGPELSSCSLTTERKKGKGKGNDGKCEHVTCNVLPCNAWLK